MKFPWEIPNVVTMKCVGSLFHMKIITKYYKIITKYYKNIIKYYKKLAGRSWPVLFTLTDFFLIHILTFSLLENKKLC